LIPTTVLNLVIGSHLLYQGMEHMETENFCGQTCHIMKPQFTAYQESPHSRVRCVECHVSPGAKGWIESKTAGTRQIFEVMFNNYPRPVPSAIETNRLVPESETCERCHMPDKFLGAKLRVIANFADDEANTGTKTVMMMKIGGRGTRGIHGSHFGPGISLRFAVKDAKRQTIPWVEYHDTNRGISRVYVSDQESARDVGKLVKYDMQCTDCHNRPTHAFDLPERAVNRAMIAGQLPSALPFIKREAVAALKAEYTSSSEAVTRIPETIKAFYQKSYPELINRLTEIEQAAGVIAAIYNRNVFPEYKVAWGTYPNNLGHTDFPGCFRCHDDAHTSADKKSITQDCATCHEMLAVDETAPEILKTLGVADGMSVAPWN
jgi:nitrate/TMAO reductase-like tetraheme cytochrome c subunit